MTSTPETRIAMRDGYYNENCFIQNAAVKGALDILPAYPDKKTLSIVDYGCAQGANSMEPLKAVLASLPAGAAATVVFEDTPFNDFSTLAKTISASLPTLAPAERNITVHASMVPVGFFQQVVPAASADLGVSWSSFNYLSRQPTVALPATAAPAEFAAARQAAFASAAHADLVHLLQLRAAEIRPGGHLVVALGGTAPEGEGEGDVPPSTTGFMPLQTALMRMVGGGQLALGELMQFALFPSHERSPGEARAALADPAVAALWRVDTLQPRLVVHPAWEPYRAALAEAGQDEQGRKAAVRAYAEAVVVNLIAASGWFWADTLRKSRGPDWKGEDAFLEEFTRVAIDECVDKFADMKVQIWYTYLRLERREM
ncbi:S-adenosyl-L-methionine-dependent methyltransferase [Lasiosphaeria ovina]|uniref:S-adenosyl-L-methionine-dependent methyltransferase n=1 Tax=Lasiosphaeria ovina TaxID=92902 RepID=A0AAE0NA12_9PEZI|nr:S-adenosyl-L-methionine-dependent methyltransferase [Lasiosphaeria ovina]